MSNAYLMDISISKYIHGKELKALKPNDQGFYAAPIGAVGVPSRSGKLYHGPSHVAAMNDQESSFYTQLIAGSLAAEYGHPIVPEEWSKRDKIKRMCIIDETRMCHYYGRIWVDNSKAIRIDGFDAIPIYGWIKPSGPYGRDLKEQLEDPYHDTSFSVRTLSQPMSPTAPDTNPDYLNLYVKAIITYDFVYAPGLEIASKRYASHNEAYGFDFNFRDVEEAIVPSVGSHNENFGINHHDISKLGHEEVLLHKGKIIGTRIAGNRTLNVNDLSFDAATLIYRR